MNPDERTALSNVVAVARRELADRESDDIPPRLRRVARSSARNLPPPFADSLLDEVANNEQFRLTVQERWSAEGLDDTIGLAFLTDPDQAQELLDVVVEKAADTRNEASIAALQKQATQLKQQLTEAQARAEKTAKAARKDVGDARTADKRARKSLEESLKAARHAEEEANAGVAAAAARIDALESEREDSRRTIDRLQNRLRKRLDTQKVDRSTDRSDAPQDPLLLAMWLDTIERRLRPYRVSSPGGWEAPEIRELHLPKGITPDSPEAIDALIVQRPARFIIDGYNVAGAVDVSSFSTRKGREAALAIAGRLVRSTGADVVVFFDAPGIEGRSEYASDFGAQVRFSRDGSADDDIVRHVQDEPVGTVVVTNDRDVRERVTEAGGFALWSDALLAWARPTP
ncbi:MAG: NYN domain-containing protein [Acidimicrobiia bacterium]